MKKIYALLFVFTFTLTFAFAQVEGTWEMAPMEYALYVGPELGSSLWWHNTTGDLTLRACYFDDKFVFDSGGAFHNVQDGETWLEQWQSGSPDACGTPVAPHDGSNAATWSFDGSNLTLTGVGAYIGLPKVINGAEINDPQNAPDSIIYPVTLSANGDTMSIDIEINAGGFWHFVLSRSTATDVPEYAKDLFSFYPNPASSEITINSDHAIDALTIHDVTGKVVLFNANLALNKSIDVSTLLRGMYILKVEAGNQQSVRKLILN